MADLGLARGRTTVIFDGRSADDNACDIRLLHRLKQSSGRSSKTRWKGRHGVIGLRPGAE